jgi:hypothetical protein
MDKRYKTSDLIKLGLGWIAKGDLPKREVKRTGQLSKNEIVELTRKDCARGANGLPVMYTAPRRIEL